MRGIQIQKASSTAPNTGFRDIKEGLVADFMQPGIDSRSPVPRGEKNNLNPTWTLDVLPFLGSVLHIYREYPQKGRTSMVQVDPKPWPGDLKNSSRTSSLNLDG